MARVENNLGALPITNPDTEVYVTELKTVAFSGASGNGAVGSVPLFTVTGDVVARVVGVVTETVVGASSTIEVGVAGNTAGILGQVSGPALLNGDVYISGSTPVGTGALSSAPIIIGSGADIIATVGTANITDGTVKFYCIWRPLSADGNVVAA